MNSSQLPDKGNQTDLPLGKSVSYPDSYDPGILFKIPRQQSQIIKNSFGFDLWRCYEFSFLLVNGFPVNLILEITVPSHSIYIVESKSLKLYLGSFAFEKFTDAESCLQRIKEDLQGLLEIKNVQINYFPLDKTFQSPSEHIKADCLDNQLIACEKYDSTDISLLQIEESQKEHRQSLYTDSFRSLCPVTGQPDYASVIVSYFGNLIKQESLLRYLISYRKHSGFHENCCEKIYQDIYTSGNFKYLMVGCYFTRRGGIEINPFRCSSEIDPNNWRFRTVRQ